MGRKKLKNGVQQDNKTFCEKQGMTMTICFL